MQNLQVGSVPPATQLDLARREKFRRRADQIKANSQSLIGFTKEAWTVLEPANPYIHGKHIEALAIHLEAITNGELSRLLINVPPGMMKSLLVSVLWPAWEWGPINRPHYRYIGTSYSENFTKRDCRRMRDLVASDWYQQCWPHVELIRTGETSFENTQTGLREGRPFSSLTGGRADRVLIDDPHSTETAESDLERERVLRIFRESVPTRLLDPTESAIVVIMQRLHERDVSGYILEHVKELGYEVLVLPMEFERERRCTTSIGFRDWRTQEGELLFPERFPREVVDRDKAVMGSHATAGQFQQRPTARGGGMFKRHWFETVNVASARIKRAVRWWDMAATAKSSVSPDPDWTAGVLMLQDIDGMFYIADVVRLRGSDLEVERAIRNTALLDADQFGAKAVQIIPEDPGSAGKFVAAHMIRTLAGMNVRKGKEDSKKEDRAEPFAAQCEAGNVKIVRARWNEAYLDELCAFPGASHDDQVDASSGAFKTLVASFDIKTFGAKGLY